MMTRRIVVAALLRLAVYGVGLLATPAAAQQSLTFRSGAFMPRARTRASTGDVLVVEPSVPAVRLSATSTASLVGGDWSVALGEYLEAGVGVGYYQETVPAVYDEWVNEDGSEIEQDLKLRIVPVDGDGELLPARARSARSSRTSAAGLGIYFWRYSETGEFVDFTDNSIYRDATSASGTAVGPVAVFGVRGPRVAGTRSSASKAATSGARASCRRTSWATRSISAASASSVDVRLPVLTRRRSSGWRRRRSIERHAAALRDALVAGEDAGGVRAPGPRACRRLPPAPRSASTRHAGRDTRAPRARCRRCLRAGSRGGRSPSRESSCMKWASDPMLAMMGWPSQCARRYAATRARPGLVARGPTAPRAPSARPDRAAGGPSRAPRREPRAATSGFSRPARPTAHPTPRPTTGMSGIM